MEYRSDGIFNKIYLKNAPKNRKTSNAEPRRLIINLCVNAHNRLYRSALIIFNNL